LILLAKSLEALGFGCVLIGLIQGIMNADMWAELYLTLIGIFLFLVGWMMEKALARGNAKKKKQQ
jgi:hypothetical protein